jgi:uncharacterized RmlC-like cupin family protein
MSNRIADDSTSTTPWKGRLGEPGLLASIAKGGKIHWEIVRLPPNGRAKAHKYDGHDTVLHILSGEIGLWYGELLDSHLAACAGDCLCIPADMPHLPCNPSTTAICVVLLGRIDPGDLESVILLPELDRSHQS